MRCRVSGIRGLGVLGFRGLYRFLGLGIRGLGFRVSGGFSFEPLGFVPWGQNLGLHTLRYKLKVFQGLGLRGGVKGLGV